MARLTVAAGEGPARARQVFQDEGVVVLKGGLDRFKHRVSVVGE